MALAQAADTVAEQRAQNGAGASCAVGHAWLQMTAADRALLAEWFADVAKSDGWIASVLTADGYRSRLDGPIGFRTVQVHRAGACRCVL